MRQLRACLTARAFCLNLLTVSIFLLSAAEARPDWYRGDISEPQGSEICNPCVVDVVLAVETLRDRGEALGFYMGAGYPEGIDHWQGIQRLPILSTSPGMHESYVVVSSNHDDAARFAVVKLESRDTDGLRLRSNRLELGEYECRVWPLEFDTTCF